MCYLCSYLQFSHSCLAAAVVGTTHGPPYVSQAAPAISFSCWPQYLSCQCPHFLLQACSSPHRNQDRLVSRQTAILSPVLTSSRQILKTQRSLPVETKSSLQVPYWSKRGAHCDIHGYSYLGIVHVQSGHASDFWEIKLAQFRHKSQTLAAKC